jgi:phage terminase large subunit
VSALAVEFEFYGAAARMLESREDEVVLSGPAGTGKSRACMVKIHLLALKYPKMKALVLRKTKESLNGSFTDEWEDVIKEPLASGMVRFFGGSARKPAQYQYSNGSTVTLGGLDQAIKIMSTQYDVSFIQEATQLTEADWDSVTTRLRNGKMPYQQLIADCNPDAETHWLKQRAERGTALMLFSLHKDNPRFFNRDGTPTPDGVVYMRRLENLTGVRRDRLLKGLWVSAEGMIFDQFDPGVHLVDLPKFAEGTRLCAQGLPWEWTRYWGIDFGHTHPFVLQRWAEDPDGRLWMYREQYMSKRIVEEHVADLKAEVFDERGNWREPPPRAILADHNAEDRATFHKHFGRGTAAANKKVNQGLDACQARFKIQGDGKPRIYFLRTALVKRDPLLAEARLPTCTVEEFPSYIWNETKDAPVKEKDDGCDTMRYVVAHRDMGVRPNIRVMGGASLRPRSGVMS